MLMFWSPTSYTWQALKLRHFVNSTRLFFSPISFRRFLKFLKIFHFFVKEIPAWRSTTWSKCVQVEQSAKCKCKSCFSLTRNCGSRSKRRKLCHSGFQIAQNRAPPMQNISAKLFPSSHPCSTITVAPRSLCVFMTKDSFSVDISLFRQQFLFPLLFPLPPWRFRPEVQHLRIGRQSHLLHFARLGDRQAQNNENIWKLIKWDEATAPDLSDGCTTEMATVAKRVTASGPLAIASAKYKKHFQISIGVLLRGVKQCQLFGKGHISPHPHWFDQCIFSWVAAPYLSWIHSFFLVFATLHTLHVIQVVNVTCQTLSTHTSLVYLFWNLW